MIRFWMLAMLLVSNVLISSAQDQPVQMADTLRQEGKIYVVVACIFVIVLGLVLFLIRIDGKLSRLEKESRSGK
jgi:K+-transporting ATPase A subunit